MKLYYAEVLNPRKACAVARYLEGDLASPVEFIHVDLGVGAHRTPTFRAINPDARVPVLIDGATTVTETDAIMCHLARRARSDLWPSDERQVEVVRWFSWNHVHFTRFAGQLYFEQVIKRKYAGMTVDMVKVANALEAWTPAARVLDAHLADRTYLVGEALSLADFAVAGALPWAEPSGIPLDSYPAIRRWHARLNDLPAWRDPFPPSPI